MKALSRYLDQAAAQSGGDMNDYRRSVLGILGPKMAQNYMGSTTEAAIRNGYDASPQYAPGIFQGRGTSWAQPYNGSILSSYL